MAVTSRVQAVFAANASGLTVGTKRASTAMDELRASVGRLQRSMSTLTAINGAQLFGSVATAATNGVRAMIALGQSTATTVDRMSKLATSAGQTYAEFAGLSYAGDLAGVGMDALAAALGKSDRVFVDAQRGAKTAQDAFASIGLSVDQLVGKTSAERFEQIAGAINALPDPAQKTAAAMKVFGRSGADLLPLFQTGAEGIRQAREEFERFGGALTNAQASGVEAMNDAWTRVKASVNAITTQVVAQFAPAVEAAFSKITGFIKEAGGASIGTALVTASFDAAAYLAQAADWLVGAFDSAKGSFVNLDTVVGVFAGAVRLLDSVFQFGVSGFEAMIAHLENSYGRLFQLVGYFRGGDWQQLGDDLVNSAGQRFERAMERSNRALAVTTNTLGITVADEMAAGLESGQGYFTRELEKLRAKRDEALRAINEPVVAAAAAGGDAAAVVGETISREVGAVMAAFKVQAVAGVDSRSTAGINQIVNAINGRQNPADVQLKRANRTLDVIARNTAAEAPDEELDF